MISGRGNSAPRREMPRIRSLAQRIYTGACVLGRGGWPNVAKITHRAFLRRPNAALLCTTRYRKSFTRGQDFNTAWYGIFLERRHASSLVLKSRRVAHTTSIGIVYQAIENGAGAISLSARPQRESAFDQTLEFLARGTLARLDGDPLEHGDKHAHQSFGVDVSRKVALLFRSIEPVD